MTKKTSLFQCIACEDVRIHRAATCSACGTTNGPQPAPKGAKLPRKKAWTPKRAEDDVLPRFGEGPILDFDEDDEDDEELEEPVAIGDVEIEYPERVPTGIRGLDRVLGCNRGDKDKKYGAVRGEGVLLQGAPGIGKTTLTVQLAKKFAEKYKVVLATGEQSASDVALYATRQRLELPSLEEGFDQLFFVRLLGDSRFEVQDWDQGRGNDEAR